jgi:hypothetical protein
MSAKSAAIVYEQCTHIGATEQFRSSSKQYEQQQQPAQLSDGSRSQ